jgi:hypothetical protein
MSGLAAAVAAIALIAMLYFWRDRRWSTAPLNAVILIAGVAMGAATRTSYWAGFFGAVLGANVLAFFITRPADIASWGREGGPGASNALATDRVGTVFVAAVTAAAAIVAVGIAATSDTVAEIGRVFGIVAMTGCAVLAWSRAGEAARR